MYILRVYHILCMYTVHMSGKFFGESEGISPILIPSALYATFTVMGEEANWTCEILMLNLFLTSCLEYTVKHSGTC